MSELTPETTKATGALQGTTRTAIYALVASAAAFIFVSMLSQAGLLLAMLITPLAFAIGVMVRPAGVSKWWALGGTLVNLYIALLLLGEFVWNTPNFQAESSVEWLPAFGLSFSLGIDGVAMTLIGLTALLGPICVLGSWTAIRERQRLFFGWLLILQTAMVAVFAARDVMIFYVGFEFTLLPMFIMINEFGSANRRRAAVKFFLYTFTGSLFALAGLVYTAISVSRAPGVEGFTLDIATLTQYAHVTMTPTEQAVVMFALLAGFAVKVPLFPLHTWLPLAHTEAPTAGSVVLAGVLLKLGTYAIYRFVLPFTPVAAAQYAPIIGVLCIIGIVYAGLICWVQTDVKKLVAYSSVSHLGFCVLGLFAMNDAGLTGSVLYMINHGLSTGALFLLIGFMYERHHTRDMRQVGGLAKAMPAWSFCMVFFAMASVGLPGLNGFVSEFMCTMGAFQAGEPIMGPRGAFIGDTPGTLGPWYAAFAGLGVIVAAIYLLYMVGSMVWGTERLPAHAHNDHDHGPKLPADLSFRELLTLAPLGVLCLAFGLFPTQTLIEAVESPVRAHVVMIQSAAREGGSFGVASDRESAAQADQIEFESAALAATASVTDRANGSTKP